MILLLSRQDDGNTHLVVEWLLSMGKPFVRINSDDERTKIVKVDPNSNQVLVEQNKRQFNLLDATSVWYRKRGISTKTAGTSGSIDSEVIFPDSPGHHRGHLRNEITELTSFICSLLDRRCKVLGNHRNYDLNKLEVLRMAAELGIRVPDVYVVTTKDDVKALLAEHETSLVTKAMSDGVYVFTRQHGYYSYTEKISVDNVEELPERFFPSLIQPEIAKRYELRVFYLHGAFYAMAIFSQKNKGTITDYRKYSKKKPNRTVPYLLPPAIREKLTRLMAALSLNTGSIDLIVDTQGEYVFLEVNPVGQITMTSQPCNYYLEKKIAQFL